MAWEVFNARRQSYGTAVITIIPGSGVRLNRGAAEAFGAGWMLISLDRSTGTIKLTHEWRPPESILLESAKGGELFGRAEALAEWLGIAEECTIAMEERKGPELIGVLP